jgi:hypothetical protein
VVGTTCNKSVELNNLVASCQQAVDNLSTSWEQAVLTHPDDKLLEQHCYMSAAGLLQLVRFYVCTATQFTFLNNSHAYARINAQVVTNLQQTCSNAVPTTCQQDVFALLVPSLLTTCYKIVELNRLVTSCSNNLLSFCNSTICQQVVSDNLVATW